MVASIGESRTFAAAGVHVLECHMASGRDTEHGGRTGKQQERQCCYNHAIADRINSQFFETAIHGITLLTDDRECPPHWQEEKDPVSKRLEIEFATVRSLLQPHLRSKHFLVPR